jgi:hypothetical protein
MDIIKSFQNIVIAIFILFLMMLAACLMVMMVWSFIVVVVTAFGSDAELAMFTEKRTGIEVKKRDYFNLHLLIMIIIFICGCFYFVHERDWISFAFTAILFILALSSLINNAMLNEPNIKAADILIKVYFWCALLFFCYFMYTGVEENN